MTIRPAIVHPGQRVITSSGTVRTVAFQSRCGDIYAFEPTGRLERIKPVCDAWGGEHDQEVDNAA